MKIAIATPAAPGTTRGNRRTALRYAAILRSLGHSVRVVERWSGGVHDLLVALHAGKSHASIAAFARAHPGRPIVVVLTGTDLYAKGKRDPRVAASLRLAKQIVVLQPEALKTVPARERAKAVSILQSAPRPPRVRARTSDRFLVVALAHLRDVKDPFLPARAARRLSVQSRIEILHAGEALDARHAREAARLSRPPSRWRWIGPRDHAGAQRLLASADLFVQTSRSEGGSVALVEALVADRPCLCTRIPAAVGMLGARHPGYFRVGDERGLARLLARAESDPVFRRRLQRATRAVRARFEPAVERAAWRALLAEITLDG